MRPDGTGLREIAQDRGPETEPAWQPFADVGVALVAVPAAGDTGFATIVTATITNKGPAVARSLTMTVELPAGVEPRGAAPPGCTLAARVLTCDVASLASGASTAFDLPATVSTAGSHTVEATLTGAVPDPAPADNRAVVLVTAGAPRADLAVT